MPTSDPSETRAFTTLQQQRVKQIAHLADSIHEKAGYLLADVRAGEYTLADGYARRAAAEIEEMRLLVAAWKALDDVRFIVEPEEGSTDG